MLSSVELPKAQPDRVFVSKGKLLLSGEFFVLKGAKALALPTKYGQELHVNHCSSYNPKLYWKSYDSQKNLWLNATYELWHFDYQGDEQFIDRQKLLQDFLKQAREQNSHFLRDKNVSFYVETFMDFPFEWGLGSSSTLAYNIAQWAYVSPFELIFKTIGGSGYDIACAQNDGPLLYELKADGSSKWSPTQLNYNFKDQIYFIHLGLKQDTRASVDHFLKRAYNHNQAILEITAVTNNFVSAKSLNEFNQAICDHERIISHALDIPPVKLTKFSDYWGEVKSLGAWGGDFVMATSNKSKEETIKYFNDKGNSVVIAYKDMVVESQNIN